MNYVIIINPNSGKKKSTDVFKKKLLPELKRLGHNFEYHFTEFPQHATKIIQHANLEDKDAIIVLGGDGTMHEVVNGMLNRKDSVKIPIGNLPTGSGNSLLYDMGKLDTKSTLNKILTHKKNKIDILKVSTPRKKYFSINLVGWGMVNDIGILAEKMRWLGPIRYNVASIIQIFRFKGRKSEILIDGKQFNEEYAFIIICNTIHIGKGMKMAPHAQLDDGKMDLIIIKNNFNRIKLLKMFPILFTGNHINDPLVEYRQAKSLKLTPNTNTILNIDGEMIGETPITIEVVPGIIKLLN